MSVLKSYLLSLATGIIITIVLVLVMLNVTMDFRVLLFLTCLLFFTGSYLNEKTKGNVLIKTGLVLLIYTSLFIKLVVIEQLTGLYYFPFFFITAGVLGGYFPEYKKKIIPLTTIFILALFSISLWAIPSAIEKNLTVKKSQPLPAIEIHQMNGEKITSEDLKGKVIVLDFFGNWCAPCIQELKELDKIQRKYESNKDVVFYVINANFGGDTPEKFQRFIDKKNYNFKYAYDYESKIYHQLKLPRGGSLPALLIVDKSQTIRMLHIGYNTAETNFSKSITQKIEQYLSEK